MVQNNTLNITKKNQKSTQDNDFLSNGNLAHKDKVDSAGNKELGIVKIFKTPELLIDIANLTATELRKKYSLEYKRWDNMKQRRHQGAIIHPEFEEFRNFLGHVGPCKNKKYTLDRLDNNDPEYAPGKVAWRDKHAQNSNKGNNVYLTHDDGRVHTVAQWAKMTNQKPSTLYKRKENGWTDIEVITGKKSDSCSNLSGKAIWPYGQKDEWESRFRKATLQKGFKGSRLEFLCDFSYRRYKMYVVEEDKLQLAIHRVQGFDDPYNEQAFGMYVDDMGYSLKCYETMSLEELTEKHSDAVERLKWCKEVYQQSKSLLDYRAEKQKLTKAKSAYLTDADILEELHSYMPEPDYTLHLPPKNRNNL